MIAFKNFKQRLFPEEKSQRSDVQETNQSVSEISTSMVKSALLSSSTVGSSPKFQPKKEKSNLQEKLNIDEKANITAGKLTLDRKFLHPNTIGSSLTSRATKKPSNTPRENNFFLDLPFRKENKESIPKSDVNLPIKRVPIKRETESQKIVSTNRLTNHQEHQLVDLVKEGIPKS